jgi:hypothetical protein
LSFFKEIIPDFGEILFFLRAENYFLGEKPDFSGTGEAFYVI